MDSPRWKSVLLTACGFVVRSQQHVEAGRSRRSLWLRCDLLGQTCEFYTPKPPLTRSTESHCERLSLAAGAGRCLASGVLRR